MQAQKMIVKVTVRPISAESLEAESPEKLF